MSYSCQLTKFGHLGLASFPNVMKLDFVISPSLTGAVLRTLTAVRPAIDERVVPESLSSPSLSGHTKMSFELN